MGHLFEPRYRLLTHRALDGGGDFAMVWVPDAIGFPMIVDPATLIGVVACIVHIEQSRQLVDGRWNLLCKGTYGVPHGSNPLLVGGCACCWQFIICCRKPKHAKFT